MTTEHNDLARDIVNADLVEYNGFSDYSSVEDAGFIKFSPHLCCCYTKPGNITQKQKDLILEYMLSHDILLYQIGLASYEDQEYGTNAVCNATYWKDITAAKDQVSLLVEIDIPL